MTVRAASECPALVTFAVPLVWVKATSDVKADGEYVIDAPSLKAFAAAVLIVRVNAPCVIVPVNALASTPWTVMPAAMFAVPLPELASKMQKSLTPGTDALLEPPDEVAQFVFAVAAQDVDAPPPTQ